MEVVAIEVQHMNRTKSEYEGSRISQEIIRTTVEKGLTDNSRASDTEK
jgi:hypothetical protein